MTYTIKAAIWEARIDEDVPHDQKLYNDIAATLTDCWRRANGNAFARIVRQPRRRETRLLWDVVYADSSHTS